MAFDPLALGACYISESESARIRSTHSAWTTLATSASGPAWTGSLRAETPSFSFPATDHNAAPTRYHTGFSGHSNDHSSGHSPWNRHPPGHLPASRGYPTNFGSPEPGVGWPGYPSNSQQPSLPMNNAYPSQSYMASTPPKPRPTANRRTKHRDTTAAAALQPQFQFHNHGHYTPSDQGRPKPLKVACNFCRGRKIRCDGNVPCAKCKAAKRECVYETSRRGRRSTTKGVHGPVENEARRNAGT
ncbi:Zn(2)-C6 fungal-type domain-containing protein [Mycena chlorophos]|uniref:Zn(2)-C6 fungal-type domain-containing protein n=1 Tax=Mycena chlorophos TaxID=658473 RepID=A0A8H6WQT9_MYCCL|nr:Zn(2)-C6 fungal-type domain-containing protein [Mycena chlorophos]